MRDDLRFLTSMDFTNPTRATARVASSIVRRLLADMMFQAAWQFLGLKDAPLIEAYDLGAVIAKIDPKYVHYAYAGGAPTEGASHRNFTLLVVPKDEVDKTNPEATAKRIHSLYGEPKRRTFTLDEFCNSPSVVSGNASVSRLGVVRYVANKLGGVHWDNKRSAWTDPVGSRHRLLDEKHIKVGALPAVHFEVISIAYDLCNSDAARRLLARIDKKAPEPKTQKNLLQFREGRQGQYAEMKFSSKTTVEE